MRCRTDFKMYKDFRNKKDFLMEFSFGNITVLLFDLCLNSKVIAVIYLCCCTIYMIGYYCAKYEHPRSKNERGSCIMSCR